MTNSPPPDPQSSQRAPLGFDEFIGIFVAFVAIGALFFWTLSRREQGFDLTSSLSSTPSPSAQPTLTPSPEVATASPAPAPLFPTVVPASPEVLTPVPSRPGRQQIPAVVPLPIPTPATPIPAPTPSATASTQPITFLDVPDGYWARPFIDALSARGIVNGYAGDYFRPDQPVTRAEFAALVQDAFDQSPGQSTTGFEDVSSDFWAIKAIDRATQAGFLKGYPENVFRPQQQIPRAQVLVALASGLNLATTSAPTQTLQTYQDAAQIPNYALEKVAAATEAGLVVNNPNPQLLDPNRAATRAEVTAIIYQALVRAGKTEPIQSQYIIRSNPQSNP